MPAKFDPVRDAVLNSPVDHAHGLPARIHLELPVHHDPSDGSPHVAGPSPHPRRATDLSVLLNFDPPSQAQDTPLFTPTTPRPPSLSHLLLDDGDLLADAAPLRRRPSLSDPSRDGSYFPHAARPFALPEQAQDPALAFPGHSLTSSPASRPSSSHSALSSRRSSNSQKPAMPPPALPAPQAAGSAPPPAPPAASPRRPQIPYAPKHRISAPSSVLVPLSPAELQLYKDYAGGYGSQILRKNGKRKREDRDPDDADDAGRPSKLSRDVGLVVEHYNARPEVGVTQRQESPIIGLKNFNNWVKSVLITRFAHAALDPSSTRPRGGAGKVLDMGCGKGGDLTKWAKAHVREYVGIDIADTSVEQARGRHTTLRGPRFAAAFHALDCYAHPLSTVLAPAALRTPFDVVSMQFCMHYAFESEAKARCMLSNVTRWLRPGGSFIGTIPNSAQLLDRLQALPPGELSFGNGVYKIRFEDRAEWPLFGHRYWFYLKDAVDDVPEYIVQWDNFVRMAAEHGLHLVYMKEFHEVFEEHQEHVDFGPLLERMKVVDKNGESQMDDDQWEAANIYIAFAFEKRL